ncbi:glycosyltransferase family 2 protein [Sphingomonas sp. PL-96]|uniref:glycosyltransferase family 2 protein n=1 Tax=Sphingomonas sp. PL-96 TaxID=2887201 RepID=UPI001E2DB2A1|nr:glycosyltransferase family A protein [Sphingomonas sp. PL-96]MCC2975520.1 glycosyltransferase family 2 protein [Sphingomonas sp. PL-96]
MISVLIPTRDRADKLARALASVAAQTKPAGEIIVVDDGSSPSEAVAIAALVACTPGARLLRHDQSLGAASARNAAANEAQGEVLAFLDSDDWWVPERLAAHRIALAQPDIVLSYNRARLTRSGAGSARGIVGRAPSSRWSLPVALAGWNFMGSCSSVCVTATAFRSVGGFDPSLPSCQDWDLWLRLSKGGDFAFVAEPLTFLDIGPHARITTSSGAVEAGHAQVHARALQLAATASERRHVAAEHLWTLAEIESRFGRPAPALGHMLQSLLRCPTARALERAPALLVAAIRDLPGQRR